MITPEAISLPEPPTDGITGLEYLVPRSSDSNTLLASSSWDGIVRVHDTSEAKESQSAPTPSCLKVKHSMASGPLLCLSTSSASDGNLYTGGLNGVIRCYNLATGTLSSIGQHVGNGSDNKVACSCIASVSRVGNPDLLISAGWDARLHVWDVRSSSVKHIGSGGDSNAKPVATVTLPAKAYSLDIGKEKSESICTVAVATANRRVCIVDLRMISSDGCQLAKASLVQDRESSLKYQTRIIRFFPDGTGMALGSIEGRVAIEYLNEDDAQIGTKVWRSN